MLLLTIPLMSQLTPATCLWKAIPLALWVTFCIIFLYNQPTPVAVSRSWERLPQKCQRHLAIWDDPDTFHLSPWPSPSVLFRPLQNPLPRKGKEFVWDAWQLIWLHLSTWFLLCLSKVHAKKRSRNSYSSLFHCFLMPLVVPPSRTFLIICQRHIKMDRAESRSTFWELICCSAGRVNWNCWVSVQSLTHVTSLALPITRVWTRGVARGVRLHQAASFRGQHAESDTS